MKSMFYLPFFLLFVTCKSQPKISSGQVYFEEIGWTVNFPKDPIFQNSKQIDSLQKATVEKIDQSKAKNFQGVPYKTLFSIVDSTFNGFSSTIEQYNHDDFKTWEELHQADKAAILKGLESQKANFVMQDTITSFENIDGIKFSKFIFKLFVPAKQMTMTTYWYATELNDYNFAVNISFVTEEKGKEFLQILRDSKFKK